MSFNAIIQSGIDPDDLTKIVHVVTWSTEDVGETKTFDTREAAENFVKEKREAAAAPRPKAKKAPTKSTSAKSTKARAKRLSKNSKASTTTSKQPSPKASSGKAKISKSTTVTSTSSTKSSTPKRSNKRPDIIQVYAAKDGFRWRQIAANGKIVGDGGEAYTRRASVHRALVRNDNTLEVIDWYNDEADNTELVEPPK